MTVAIVSEYDYDTPYSGRLLSCAAFSTREKAKAYAIKKADRYGEPEVDEYGNACVFDEDFNDYAIKIILVNAEIDKFC